MTDVTHKIQLSGHTDSEGAPTITKMEQWFKFGADSCEPFTITFGTMDIQEMQQAPVGTVWRLCRD